MKKLVVVLPVMLLMLSGCWPQVGFGPEHQRHNPNENSLVRANVTRLREVWSVDVAGSAGEPVTSSDTVYVTDTTLRPVPQVKVRALRLTDGATSWERTLFSNTSDDLTLSLSGGTPTMSGADLSTVWWTTQQPLGPAWCLGEQVRLDPATGVVRATRGDVIADGPVTAGAIVAQVERPITGTRPDPCAWGPARLVVHDAATGATWSFVPPGRALAVYPPTIHGGRIYLAADTTLYSFPVAGCGASTCEPLWSRNFEIPTHEGTQIIDFPVADGNGRILVATSRGRLGGGGIQALDADTGAVIWSAPLNPRGDGSLAYADGVLYVIAADITSGVGTLHAFAAAGCGSPTCATPRWSGRLGTPASSPPVVAGGLVYAGASDGVHAFDSGGCGGSLCLALTVIHGSDPAQPLRLSVTQGRLLVRTGQTLTAFAPR